MKPVRLVSFVCAKSAGGCVTITTIFTEWLQGEASNENIECHQSF